MPYPRYNSYSSSRSKVNPWDGGSNVHGLLPTPGQNVNPMALVNNLVGAIMSQNMAQVGVHQSMDDRRRGRSRSPIRRGGGRNMRSRSRSRDRRRRSPRRKRSPPADRAEHEIYIGNYPASYREDNIKNLFKKYDIEVGKIRMKSDGQKVFAFAETSDLDTVEKAISVMDGEEINGRRLRVRSSKATDKKRQRTESKPQKEREPIKKPTRVPTIENSKPHMVTAFVKFLDRELEAIQGEENEERKGLVDAAKTALIAAYNLPSDNSLAINRNIEDIFFKAARMDIKLPEEPEVEPEKSAEMTEENKEGSSSVMEAEVVITDDKKEVNSEVACNDDDEEEVVVEQLDNLDELQGAEEDNEENAMEADGENVADDDNILADLENALANEEESDAALAMPDSEVVAENVESTAITDSKKEEPKKSAPTRGRGGRGRRGKRSN